jgi:hypothetical protein
VKRTSRGGSWSFGHAGLFVAVNAAVTGTLKQIPSEQRGSYRDRIAQATQWREQRTPRHGRKSRQRDVSAALEANPTSAALKKLATTLDAFTTTITNKTGHIVDYRNGFLHQTPVQSTPWIGASIPCCVR